MQPEFETQFVTAGSLLYAVEHRPWLPPDSHWLLSQRLNDVLLMHFAMEPAVLRKLVPEELTLELYDGVAWLTVTPFTVSHVRPSGVPPLPGISFYSQINVRTYVTMNGKPGIYFFSLDASNLSTVWFARVFFRMQYWHSSIQVSGATIQSRPGSGKDIHFRARRLHGPAAQNGAAKLDVVYAPEGEPEKARAGSLDAFLTERYCAYSWHRRTVYRTEVHHQPWALQRVQVSVKANSIAEPLGIALPDQPEICHFSRSLKMLSWAPEKIHLRR